MTAEWTKYTLNFKVPSGTSRGVMTTKDSYFLKISKDDRVGIGECGLLKGLSVDDRPDYEDKLDWLINTIQAGGENLHEELKDYPSIVCGLEAAELDFKSEDHILFPSEFTNGTERQPINGLIWMGDVDFMLRQIKDKIEQGFLVIKLKIGAINFEDEYEIIKKIRSEFGPHEIQIRVDANGAFSPDEALQKLEALDNLRVHSIEQPIKAGQWEELARLCEKAYLPIALDEELIGVHDPEERKKLLDTINPNFLILKPSLLGGFKSCEQWIDFAEERGKGWWVTSALESNIGLNAIAQWNYTLYGVLASGLGTGGLFTNNFQSPLDIVRGTLAYNRNKSWEIEELFK